MFANYPNLELLEYKAKQILAADTEFMDSLGSHAVNFEVIVFPQTWGSTCTGFDICPDGSPAVGGSAITKEYTSVFHELTTDTYVVCFGNRPCYKVTDAPMEFYADLSARSMASLKTARTRY